MPHYRYTIGLASLLLVALGVTGLSRAAPEDETSGETVSYTGYLEQGGSPATGSQNLAFRLFDAETGGTELWPLAGDGVATVGFTAGRFTVELGGEQMSSLPPEAFTHPELWLEVSVEGTRLGGRQRVGTSRLAVHAMNSRTSTFSTLADNGAPPGTIVAYGGATAPAGWLLCDGRALDRDLPENSMLFDAIGTAWGDGSAGALADPGTTDFNLPDLRGRFLRGVDSRPVELRIDPDRDTRTASSAGGNSGAQVGSAQEDATALPTRSFQFRIIDANTDSGDSECIDTGETCQGGWRNIRQTWLGGDSETRPTNVAVTYIIKA